MFFVDKVYTYHIVFIHSLTHSFNQEALGINDKFQVLS